MVYCRPIDEDLDGQEMSDGEYDERSQDSYGTPRRQQPQEMTEERRQKLREVEVRKQALDFHNHGPHWLFLNYNQIMENQTDFSYNH